jgi:hypothetical protein
VGSAIKLGTPFTLPNGVPAAHMADHCRCSRTRIHKPGNRPPNAGRNNWLHVDGGLRPAAVLVSLAASVKRHGVNPWTCCKHILAKLPSYRVGPTWLVYSRRGWIVPPSARAVPG